VLAPKRVGIHRYIYIILIPIGFSRKKRDPRFQGAVFRADPRGMTELDPACLGRGLAG
jgi:hypothetical protein